VTEAGLASIYALFLWWFSTGVILLVIGLPRRSHPWSFGAATIVLAASLWGLAATADDTSASGAYIAFTCAVLVWAWQEVGFLAGIVTGPRKEPLRAGSRGVSRVFQALQAIAYHEAALVACGAAVMLTTAGGANRVGLWTFAVLWVMRLSAKLNLFLGVPNRGEEFLPTHLRFIGSYFAHRPMNLLFPLSITLPTIALVLIGIEITAAGAGTFEAAALSLVAALLALAVLEHWFFVLPIPSIALWRWSLRSRKAAPLSQSPCKTAATAAPVPELALDDRRLP
jgi:putative photosynthetic complex assembly protein 2